MAMTPETIIAGVSFLTMKRKALYPRLACFRHRSLEIDLQRTIERELEGLVLFLTHGLWTSEASSSRLNPHKFMDLDQGSKTDVPADAAESMVSMLDEKIEALASMRYRRMIRDENRNRLEAVTALVPGQEVTDRLQRYEGSLERSFDRTLSQLERLQRLRKGQPVLPALKVDVSH